MKAKSNKSPDAPSSGNRFHFPWWANIFLAIGSYCSLKFIIPELHFTHPTLQNLAKAAPALAPLATIPFLLLAAKQLYDVDYWIKDTDKQENEQNKNPED